VIDNFPLQFFVLDIVTIFLFIGLAAQTYYIYLLSHKIGSQNKELSELKEIVYAVYEASKGNPNVQVKHVKMTPDGK
jgi:hypothetical protein